MACMTLDEFMARYNPEGEHPVTEISVTADSDGYSPFVVISDGIRTVIVNPLAFHDHLSVDIHSFVNGQDATAGVFGMTNGRQFVFPPDTGSTSHGWSSAHLIVVMVGDQRGKPA